MPCHKHILAAASKAFAAMIENNHREAVEGEAYIRMDDIKLTEDIGYAFVKFIYTGTVDEAVLKEFALGFLALGEMYDLQELKELAEVELVDQLDKENMLEMISIGEDHKADQLYEAALKYTKANLAWLRSQVGCQSNF